MTSWTCPMPVDQSCYESAQILKKCHIGFVSQITTRQNLHVQYQPQILHSALLVSRRTMHGHSEWGIESGEAAKAISLQGASVQTEIWIKNLFPNLRIKKITNEASLKQKTKVEQSNFDMPAPSDWAHISDPCPHIWHLVIINSSWCPTHGSECDVGWKIHMVQHCNSQHFWKMHFDLQIERCCKQLQSTLFWNPSV